MAISPRKVSELLGETRREWNEDNCLRLGAALAYSTIFSIAPLLVFVKERLASSSMILVIGFLLLVSLIMSAALAGLRQFVSGPFPGTALVMEVLNFAISFGVITLLFAMIFQILPDATIRWGDVWVGAAFTAFLFGAEFTQVNARKYGSWVPAPQG